VNRRREAARAGDTALSRCGAIALKMIKGNVRLSNIVVFLRSLIVTKAGEAQREIVRNKN